MNHFSTLIDQFCEIIMERFDAFYTEIAKESGNMDAFIDSFMSFLLRRTDFFYEADPGDKMGFPPGACETMIASSFKKHQEEHYKRHPKKSPEEFKRKIEENRRRAAEEPAHESTVSQPISQQGEGAKEKKRQPQVAPPTPKAPAQTQPPVYPKTPQAQPSDIRCTYKHVQRRCHRQLQMAAKRV